MPRFWSSASISARGSSCAGCGSIGASVEDTLTTTTRARSWRVRKALRSVTMRASAACGSSRASRPVMPGPLLGLGRLERAGERGRAGRRQHAVVDEAGGADRQRRLHDVVAAEDEIAERRQPGVGERRAHGDQPGRLGEARRRPRRRRSSRSSRPTPGHRRATPPRDDLRSYPWTLRHRTSVASCLSSAHRFHFMLPVKTKSVRWKAKQIFRLVPLVLALALLVALRGAARGRG